MIRKDIWLAVRIAFRPQSTFLNGLCSFPVSVPSWEALTWK